LVRALLASAALVAALALAACDTDQPPTLSGRHLQPLSDRLAGEIEAKNMTKDSAILVRIFKEESELEVWKEDRTGRFALLKTYPICRWSGELGPKIKQGDRQAPEGYYTITPGLMNPNSNYYLAINTGFPNAYDRANGRTGAFLMIHGDCSSAGCYAMTDEQIAEIYALARESFFGGQKSFQIQAYPFRMTPLNMARHRNSPHMAFWKMLKQGHDHFEVTRLEPKVDVCEGRYVFNAETSARFSAADQCPAYSVPADIAAAVRDKQHQDEVKIADLINRGAPAAPVTTGIDGGMNPTFLSAVKSHGGPGATIRTAIGTIPPHVNPPGEPSETGSTLRLASTGFFSNLFGSKSDDQNAETRAETAGAKPKPASSTRKPAQTGGTTVRPKSPAQAGETKTANGAATFPEKSSSKPQQASSEAAAAPSPAAAVISGAQPTVSSGVFEGRFGSWR
jgi:murein L,D-transpeptidase YafK